jgi:two-component system alkaline phosphatase synthesis response regulator PhoP
MATVLALDKDTLNLDLLTFLLNQDGHKVHATTNPDMAFEILRSHHVDLFVVETELLRHDGHWICQRIRQEYRALPLMIVSERHEEDQIVQGLMEAADDYVTKPFSPRQFLARVRALLRRSGHDDDRSRGDNLAIDEIDLDLPRRQATVNGTALHLTPRELSLLHALVTNHNRVLSREQLIEQAWGGEIHAGSKEVDAYVLRLRKKMQRSLRPGFYIRSWRGFGYSFEIPKSEARPGLLDDRNETDAGTTAHAAAAISPTLTVV